ncbi:MAG: tRNA (N(6)-L-threonylcarbamoyladenosine(37)-C(2))-methylthiotransferase MtaB [Candidatus Enterosoma sp.]|nr:tRNA (N(6)-L-threonylcarbamoyladenosine(37)-C(2))-methylthiotransferase MtaB [Candidatus Enterosoma sp.]
MTFKIVTLGCKVNSYESSIIEDRLLTAGYRKDEVNPDYIFLNTCAVTANAEKQDRQVLRSLIKKYPESKFVVVGCSAQVNKDDYLKYKEVIIVKGNDKKCRIDNLDSKIRDQVNLSSRSFIYDEERSSLPTYKSKAYLKIQDGCDNFCSYCIVPIARGKSRSRDKDSILKELQEYISSGIKEIIIGGIDVSSYGNNSYTLTDLIKKMTSFKGDYRIRISSIEISRIDENYVSLFKDNPHLAYHFHIPLQSGSNKILKLMNRKYTREEFISKVNMIKNILPGIALSTDVITGFPGENEEDFNDTFSLLKDLSFMKIHAFPYSERKYTKAITLSDSVDKQIRKKRVKILDELSKENQKKYYLSSKDNLDILIEKVEGNKVYGYSSNNLYVCAESDNAEVGTIINVSPSYHIYK